MAVLHNSGYFTTLTTVLEWLSGRKRCEMSRGVTKMKIHMILIFDELGLKCVNNLIIFPKKQNFEHKYLGAGAFVMLYSQASNEV